MSSTLHATNTQPEQYQGVIVAIGKLNPVRIGEAVVGAHVVPFELPGGNRNSHKFEGVLWSLMAAATELENYVPNGQLTPVTDGMIEGVNRCMEGIDPICPPVWYQRLKWIHDWLEYASKTYDSPYIMVYGGTQNE